MFLVPLSPYNEPMTQYTDKQLKDLKVLAQFVRIYCAARHDGQSAAALPEALAGQFKKGIVLCPACRELLEHALLKRLNCPLEPKPTCRDCHIHCYSMEYRAKIREIMAYSGRKMILRGRLDYLWHYFF
jgi:hypothetical protein